MPRRRVAKPAQQQQLGRPEDYEKLPRRFKDYVQGLEGRLYTAEKLLQEQPESLVWLEVYGFEVSKRHLASDARLRFQTPTGIIEVQLDARRGHAGLSVSTPDGRLFVLSECSNEIGVKVGRI